MKEKEPSARLPVAMTWVLPRNSTFTGLGTFPTRWTIWSVAVSMMITSSSRVLATATYLPSADIPRRHPVAVTDGHQHPALVLGDVRVVRHAALGADELHRLARGQVDHGDTLAHLVGDVGPAVTVPPGIEFGPGSVLGLVPAHLVVGIEGRRRGHHPAARSEEERCGHQPGHAEAG